MPDQDQPKLPGTLFRFADESLPQQLKIICDGRGIQSDRDRASFCLRAGLLPERSLPQKITAILGFAGSPNDEDNGGVIPALIGGTQGGCAIVRNNNNWKY